MRHTEVNMKNKLDLNKGIPVGMETVLQKLSCQKPAWLVDIERRENRLLEVTNLVQPLVPALADTISSLPTHTMAIESCARGLDTFRYILDVSAFLPDEHTLTMKTSLMEVTSALDKLIPRTLGVLDISRLCALECETAKVIKAIRGNPVFSMSSFNLADSLRVFSEISERLLPQIDRVLSSSQLLYNYSNLVENQYKKIQKSPGSHEKYLHIVDLATTMVQEQIETVSTYAECAQYESAEEDEAVSFSDSRTVIQFIPSYLGYTLRESASYDLDDEFEKSAVNKISSSGKEIVEKITYINEVCMSTGQEMIFSPTNKSFKATLCLATAFSTDQNTFGNVIDSLYMVIYEGSGEAKRILKLLSDEECSAIWKIKHIRTDFRHDIEHGDEAKYMKKKALIGEAYESICHKIRPIRQKDWVTAHSNLFAEVIKLLDLIIMKLS